MKVIKFGGVAFESQVGVESALQVVRNEFAKSKPLLVVISAFRGITDELINLAYRSTENGSSIKDLFAKVDEIKNKHLEVIGANLQSNSRKIVEEKIEALALDLHDVVHSIFLVKDVSLRTLDLMLSFGERMAAEVISGIFCAVLGKCELLDSRDVVETDSNFGSALVDFNATQVKISKYFAGQSQLVLTTGFIAASKNKETTTLGRGGSNYTAAIFAAALKAEEIQIWTNVDGIMTADPHFVRTAFTIDHLTFAEAMELSHFGAKVINSPSMQPAVDNKIPVRIKNVLNPEAKGTLISDVKPQTDRILTGVTSISDIALLALEGSGMLGVSGIARRLFDALYREQISVILISQASSEHSICFAIKPDLSDQAKRAIDREFSLEIQSNKIAPVVVRRDVSIVAVVGQNMQRAPGIAGRLFQALGKNGINVIAIAQGSSELNISAVIPSHDEAKALNAIHDSFFLSEIKTLNLFVVGTGNVGSKLLEQIHKHRDKLFSEKRRTDHQRLDIRIAGVANSRKMLLTSEGISLDNWKDQLESAVSESFKCADFVAEMFRLNLPNSIFVDCTANDEVAKHYESILRNSVSIVTPNKRANSGSYKLYQQLKDAAHKATVKFFYETNVGAGLPVIGTLQDLVASGDTVMRIDAVLSGTLSYIFNSFTGERTFSEIVLDAKSKGYTEPDPRDDLSGKDVARKLLILAREMGLPLEENDVEVQSLIPDFCRPEWSVQEFMSELSKADRDMELLRKNASDEGMVLRYIGSVNDGRAAVKIEAVSKEHPFYSLSGSDNVISFVTSRYHDRPLVVKGPGAGTEVTAAGVFADIIRVGSYLG